LDVATEVAVGKNVWGFEVEEWDAAKSEGKELLAGYARRRQMIPYSTFVQKIKAITIEAHDPRLPHFLGEISSEESAAGRGMLTALVVHKTGDFQPGPGFFELAQQLGHQFKDIEKFWIQEVKRVFEAWAKK
jgi:hypothetical protein